MQALLDAVLWVNNRLSIVRLKPQGVLKRKASVSSALELHGFMFTPFHEFEVKPFVALKDGTLSPDPIDILAALTEEDGDSTGVALLVNGHLRFTFCAKLWMIPDKK
jgi:hypothetical protein